MFKAVRDMMAVSMRLEGDIHVYQGEDDAIIAHPFFVIAIAGVREAIPAKRIEKGRPLAVVGLVTPWACKAAQASGTVTKLEKNLGGAEQKNRGFFYLLLILAPPT